MNKMQLAWFKVRMVAGVAYISLRNRLTGGSRWISEGTDQSKWQDPNATDWKAASVDHEFAIFKVSQGLVLDPNYTPHWKRAYPHVLIGFYIFWEDAVDPVQQMQFAIDALAEFVRVTGVKPLIVIDAERATPGISNFRRLDDIKIGLDRATAQGFAAGLYSNYDFVKNYLSPAPSWIDDGYILFPASYTSAPEPVYPPGWSPDWCLLWQYGIYGKHWWVKKLTGSTLRTVDKVRSLVTGDDLRAVFNYPPKPVDPPPVEPPPTDPAEPADTIVFAEVQANGVRVRSEPSTDGGASTIIRTVNTGDVLPVYDFTVQSGSRLWMRVSPVSADPEWVAAVYDGGILLDGA